MLMTVRRRYPRCEGLVIRGRLFDQSELVRIRNLIRQHPSWGRTQLSTRICELLHWRQPNGRVKDRACRVAMLRLEELGLIELPPPKLARGGRPPKVERELAFEACRMPVTEMPSEVRVSLACSRHEIALWNSAIAAYHYLGLATPVGRLLRYLFFDGDALLGALSFTDCSWATSARKKAATRLGISHEEIRTLVAANNRFLIPPSVRVPNLASRLLSKATKNLRNDWRQRFGVDLALAETFVDPSRFLGTSYLAANWVFVGHSKGYSKRGRQHVRHNNRKVLLMRGLTRATQRRLFLSYTNGNQPDG